MEYVFIRYHRKRKVFIDGNHCGQTNETLRVDAGTHRFDLGQPVNYSPSFRRVSISGTTVITPKEISFEYVKEGA